MAEAEGQWTNIISNFVLENQDTPEIQTPIPILFSGYLYDFEKPIVGTELQLYGSWYRVTRIIPPSNPGNPSVNTYYVEKLVKKPDTSKETPHDQWKFVWDC